MDVNILKLYLMSVISITYLLRELEYFIELSENLTKIIMQVLIHHYLYSAHKILMRRQPQYSLSYDNLSARFYKFPTNYCPEIFIGDPAFRLKYVLTRSRARAWGKHSEWTTLKYVGIPKGILSRSLSGCETYKEHLIQRFRLEENRNWYFSYLHNK